MTALAATAADVASTYFVLNPGLDSPPELWLWLDHLHGERLTIERVYERKKRKKEKKKRKRGWGEAKAVMI